jgi:hypothetical protein
MFYRRLRVTYCFHVHGIYSPKVGKFRRTTRRHVLEHTNIQHAVHRAGMTWEKRLIAFIVTS